MCYNLFCESEMLICCCSFQSVEHFLGKEEVRQFKPAQQLQFIPCGDVERAVRDFFMEKEISSK